MTQGEVTRGGGGAEVAVKNHGSRPAVPPAGAAGLTQATCTPDVAVCPDCRLTPWPGRAKSASAGGCEGKFEYAMTQPASAPTVHSGTWRKLTPTVLPMGTATLPPARMASTV